ncbi:MAG: glycoside hydrolase family 42, partial [Acidobacteriales bacterium]
MKLRIPICCAAIVALAFLAGCSQTQPASDIPRLQKQGTATQLIVDGKPFLMLAGELHNSSSSNLAYMQPIWPRLAAMHINTVLPAVSWELIEPQEGKFDFALVDGLIRDARTNNMRLVLLWFGSWKNGMSSYTPAWVKANQDRFPRVQDSTGKGIEILSTFGEQNRDADARAFAALMRHIREVDGRQRTVVMMQVENEVGVLGDSRDRSEAANKAFAEPVPKELMDHLQKHRNALAPEFGKVWEAAGSQTSGTWEQVFGKGPATDEVFMAWYYARYIDHVTAAGKKEYPLPMYVNAWLSGPDGKPGDWPSGGPLPQVMPVWQAGAPQIDFLAPDIYATNFTDWCTWFHQSGNPLFIPETSGATGAFNAFYAFGQHDAMGFAPFAIDSLGISPLAAARAEPADLPLTKSYETLSQLAPLIKESQGKGVMAGVVVSAGEPPQKVTLGGYTLEVSYPRGRAPAPPAPAKP